MKEYIYQASIQDAETDEVLIRISSFSQEGLEEEMGKSKWSGAVERYEEKLEKEAEQDRIDAEEEREELKKPEFLMTEEELAEANKELEWAHNDEMKREEMGL